MSLSLQDITILNYMCLIIWLQHINKNVYRIVSRITVEDFIVILSVWEDEANKNKRTVKSLVVQWLELSIFTAEGLGSIPGRGTKILQAALHGMAKETNKQNPKTQKPENCNHTEYVL